LEQMMILDVGCGKGNWLRFLLSLGARPENLHGIEWTLIPGPRKTHYLALLQKPQ